MENKENLIEKIKSLRENLDLIELRISKFVKETDADLQLFKEQNRLKKEISNLQVKLFQLEGNSLIKETFSFLESLDEIKEKSFLAGFSQNYIKGIEELLNSLTIAHEVFKDSLDTNSSEENLNKSLNHLKTVLNLVKKKVPTLSSNINFHDTHPVSSTLIISDFMPPSNFTDREEQIEFLKAKFEEYNILIIAGLGGVGKSSLIHKFVIEITGWKVIGVKCTKDISIEKFFFSISAELVRNWGEVGLGKLLRKITTIGPIETVRLLTYLDTLKVCIIFDDFHKTNEDFETVIETIENSTRNLKVIVGTRRRTNSLANLFSKSELMTLEGIPMAFLKEYLNQYRLYVEDELVKSIYEHTSGHPLALKLFASLCAVKRYSPEDLLEEYSDIYGLSLEYELLQKIYEELNGDEKELLCKFSVFRTPVNRAGIEFINEKPSDVVINSLLFRFLITEPLELEFITHDLIRTFSYERLEDKDKIHFLAGEYYITLFNKTSDIDYNLEAYYHFFLAKDYLKAQFLVEQSVPELELNGQYRLVLELIHQLEEVTDEISPNLLIKKARVLEIYGKWNESERILSELLIRYKTNVDIYLPSLNILLHIYDQKGQIKEGLIFVEKYQENISNVKESSDLSHYYHRIGRFYQEINDYSKAMSYYERSLDISEKLIDKKNIARTKRLIGTTNWFIGKYDIALKQLQEVLIICQEDNNKREYTDALKHIGIVYLKLERYNESYDCFIECIKINRDLGYVHGIAWSLTNFSDTLLELGKFDEALVALNEALEIFSNNSEISGIINSSYRIGIFYTKMKNYTRAEKALKDALVLSREHNYLLWQANTLIAISDLNLVLNQSNKAISNLKNAIIIHEKIKSENIDKFYDKLAQIQSKL